MAEKYDQGPQGSSVVQAEARPSAPASYKQRLGIGMAMVATAFPHGLNEEDAEAFLDRLFSYEEGYREQAVADLLELIKSNLSKQAEEKDMNHGDEGSEVSGARQSQRRDENRRASDRDHRWPGRSG
jgi:hypothetical protein